MWEEIKDAPKDGTKVRLCYMEDGVPMDSAGPFMWFDDENNWPIQMQLGIWLTPDKSFAWSVENPDGAPTHFQHYN